MTTVRYARYVLMDEKIGLVAWCESKASAERLKAAVGGEVFDTDAEDNENLEIILHHARKNMGGIE